MATYWDEEERKKQQEQLQAQQAQQTQKTQQQTQQNTQLQQAAQNAPNMKQQTSYMGNYQQGAAVQQVQQMLQQQINNKPGNYQSPYMQQVSQLYDQVMNRPQFNYNINADPLYQQYKNQYVQQGQRAMRDTVGTMAGLTGGYGNSYAQGAGQQEYQRYLGLLNNVMPELYAQAYTQYTQEGDELRQNLATAQDMENQGYSRYRDSLGDWQAERDYLTGRYDTEAKREYGQYMDALGYRNDAYSLAIDMMSRGMMPDQQTLQMAGLTEDQATAYMKSLKAGTGSGSGTTAKQTTGLANAAANAAIDAWNNATLKKLASSISEMAANVLKAGLTTKTGGTVMKEVAEKYGNYDKEYQEELSAILGETENEKKKKK